MGRSAALALVLATLGHALQAQAATPEREIRMAYRFHAGGFEVGEVAMTARLGAAGYEARSFMRTAGLADTLFKSRYEVVSQGAIIEGRVRPASYVSTFKGAGDKRQFVRLLYDGTGMPGPVEADPPYGRRLEKYPVSPAQKQLTVDPLSAMIFMLTGSSASQEAPCGGEIPIFDGRRRYSLTLAHGGEEEVNVGREGAVFKGTALRCTLEYRRIAGFKPTGRDDDEFPIPPLEVYVSRDHGSGLLVPVRILADTPYFSVVLTLSAFAMQEVPALVSSVP